jgi:hypothetical protein
VPCYYRALLLMCCLLLDNPLIAVIPLRSAARHGSGILAGDDERWPTLWHACPAVRYVGPPPAPSPPPLSSPQGTLCAMPHLRMFPQLLPKLSG